MALTYLTFPKIKRYLGETSLIVESVDIDANTITITNNSLENATPIKFSTTSDLPSPLVADTTYYVLNATANTLQVAEYPNGTAITLTDEGSGVNEVWGAKNDTLLEDIENSVAYEIQQNTNGVDFETSSRTETLYNQTNEIFLTNYPVQSITSVTRTGGTAWDSDNYHLELGNVLVSEVGNFGDVVIVYSAGYDGLPTDLELVMLKKVALDYKRSKPGGDLLVITGESNPTGSITTVNLGNTEKEFQAVLNRYNVGNPL